MQVSTQHNVTSRDDGPARNGRMPSLCQLRLFLATKRSGVYPRFVGDCRAEFNMPISRRPAILWLIPVLTRKPAENTAALDRQFFCGDVLWRPPRDLGSDVGRTDRSIGFRGSQVANLAPWPAENLSCWKKISDLLKESGCTSSAGRNLDPLFAMFRGNQLFVEGRLRGENR